jgi:5-methylcytosine-specific restriction endonuclease McrA
MEAHYPTDLTYELKAFRSSDAKRLFKQQIIERDNGQCRYCGCTNNLTLDHIRPKSKGGRYEASNLVAACRECNQSKGSNDVFDWFLAQPFFNHDLLQGLT